MLSLKLLTLILGVEREGLLLSERSRPTRGAEPGRRKGSNGGSQALAHPPPACSPTNVIPVLSVAPPFPTRALVRALKEAAGFKPAVDGGLLVSLSDQ